MGVPRAGRILLFSGLLSLVVYLLALASPALLSPPYGGISQQSIKGGGVLGYRLGFAGVVMLLAAETYSFKIRGTGSKGMVLREWLNLHCYLSTAGSALILLHSGLPFSFTYANPFAHMRGGLGLEGLVGVQGLAAWLVLLVMISGLLGRYILRRIGLGLQGHMRYWILLHTALSGALYAAGVTHLVVAVGLRHVSAA